MHAFICIMAQSGLDAKPARRLPRTITVKERHVVQSGCKRASELIVGVVHLPCFIDGRYRSSRSLDSHAVLRGANRSRHLEAV